MSANGIHDEPGSPGTMSPASDIEEMDNVKLEKHPKKSAMKSVVLFASIPRLADGHTQEDSAT